MKFWNTCTFWGFVTIFILFVGTIISESFCKGQSCGWGMFGFIVSIPTYFVGILICVGVDFLRFGGNKSNYGSPKRRFITEIVLLILAVIVALLVFNVSKYLNHPIPFFTYDLEKDIGVKYPSYLPDNIRKNQDEIVNHEVDIFYKCDKNDRGFLIKETKLNAKDNKPQYQNIDSLLNYYNQKGNKPTEILEINGKKAYYYETNLTQENSTSSKTDYSLFWQSEKSLIEVSTSYPSCSINKEGFLKIANSM